MADIYDFPQSEQQRGRLLQHWVTSVIEQHPDKKVAEWPALAIGAACGTGCY